MRTFTFAAAFALLTACASPTAQGTTPSQGSAAPAAAPAAPARCQSDWDCGNGYCIDQVCRK